MGMQNILFTVILFAFALNYIFTYISTLYNLVVRYFHYHILFKGHLVVNYQIIFDEKINCDISLYSMFPIVGIFNWLMHSKECFLVCKVQPQEQSVLKLHWEQSRFVCNTFKQFPKCKIKTLISATWQNVTHNKLLQQLPEKMDLLNRCAVCTVSEKDTKNLVKSKLIFLFSVRHKQERTKQLHIS